MPTWLDNWLDQQISRLGYTKARGDRVDIGTVFAGEAPLLTGDVWGSMTQDDWDRLAITSSWIYSDIDLIAKEASRAKLEVHSQQGEELVAEVDHEFERLMAQPNPFMSRSFLKRYTLTWWLLRGEAYWWIVPDQAGEVAQLWPIPANRMAPIPDKTGYISGYSYTAKHGEPPEFIPPEIVCFFRLPNPFDYHRGMSPLTAYSKALETDMGAQDWNKGIFTDGIPFRTILSMPLNASKPDRARFQQEIRDEFESRKRILIASGGDIKAQELGASSRDMEFLAGREFTREEIDRVFGVPAGFWAKEATRANSEAARASLIEYAVWPLLVLMSEQIDTQILRPRYGEDLTCQPEDIRFRDRELVIAEQEHKREVQTFNQARAELGDDVYDGPMAELIAELPVPLATDPRFVMAYAGLGSYDQPTVAEVGVEPAVNTKAMKADLKRWQSVARRRVRAGENPGGYDFKSGHIPADVAGGIKAALDGADTDEGVKAAFSGPFRSGNRGERQNRHRSGETRLDLRQYATVYP